MVATEKLEEIQLRTKHWFDKTSTIRNFQIGDKVLANTTQEQPCFTNQSLQAEEQSTPWLRNSKFLNIF